MKKNRKNKGFTLVELIVVLVILAILAAMLVPALTGYIDKANEKVVAAEARATLLAAQTLVSDLYGRTPSAFVAGSITSTTAPAADDDYDGTNPAAPVAASSITWANVRTLAELAVNANEKVQIVYDNSGKIIFCYYNNAKYVTTYTVTAAAKGWSAPERVD